MAQRWIPKSGAGGRGAPGPAGIAGSSAVAIVLRPTLVHNTTTTVASPGAGAADGQMLITLLKQPSNGGGRVAWAGGTNGFSADTPTAVNTATGNSIARVMHVWSDADAKWVYVLIMNSGGLI